MLSLAPLKYRNIFSEQRGPIEKLNCNQVQITQSILGYEAACYLKTSIKSSSPINFKIYDNPDGMGSDTSKSIACYKAISEALERWAYSEAIISPTKVEFGFDIDPSTSGLAAYPGITTSGARNTARLEALERWALVNWWEGKFSATQHQDGGLKYLSIQIPGKGAVVVTWMQIPTLDKISAYGFAADAKPKEAFLRAQIELFRNVEVLKRYFNSTNKISKDDLDIQEQRLLWFASELGFKNFQRRVDASVLLKISNPTPELIVDKEIKGPWSKYATVWRSLYKQTSQDSGLGGVDYFLF